jgi:LysM repeat protein
MKGGSPLGSLYREFFHIPKDGKIQDKVMLTRVVMTAAIMVVCLIAMSFTAYAYFTAPEVVAPNNQMMAARFQPEMLVTSDDSPVELAEGNIFLAEAGKEYVVSLRYVEGSAETGFCGIKIDHMIYHTEQIGADKEAKNGFRGDTKFSIAIQGTGSIEIQLIPHWGTSSHYDLYSENGEENEFYVIKGEVITLNVAGGKFVEGYVVQVGDTLWDVAEIFDISVEKLAAYNDIDDISIVNVGRELKIPPADWVMPPKSEAEQKKPAETTPPVTTATTPPVTTTVPTTTTESAEPSETITPPEKTEPEGSLPAEEEKIPPATEENN